jgi:hypothetical protein
MQTYIQVSRLQTRLVELEGKLRERTEELLTLERAKHESEERARVAQANFQVNLCGASVCIYDTRMYT